jgi:nicotinate phosphoribosyltransferase
MAHSFVSSFEREIDAFRSFVSSFPDHSILLVDTYDTISGTRNAIEVSREMASKGGRLRGVRIDSGDLASLALEVRQMLDEACLSDVKIIGSGGLDEYDLAALSEAKTPYDSYGVGTKMGVSADAPWFDMAYKLVEYNGRPVLKLSTGKATVPGGKQVFRSVDGRGRLEKDIIGLRGEQLSGCEALLHKVMEHGRPAGAPPTLREIRQRFLEEFSRLDEKIKAIRNPSLYPVELTPKLRRLRDEIEQQVTQSK